MATVIEFCHRSKLVVPLGTTLRSRQSKAALLKAAHTACRQDDPIYALIYAHREAWRQWSEAVDVEADMYPYDPKIPAAEAEVRRRADIKGSLLCDLNSARPLTIGGVAALAEYYGESTLPAKASWARKIS